MSEGITSINTKVNTSDPTKPMRYEFRAAINRAFLITYRPDGVDFFDDPITINNVEIKNVVEGEAYLKSYITTLTGFLGLPNRKLICDEGQSWKNIGLNFIGWQEDASWIRLILNFIIMLPLHIITTPLKFAFNILRLATQVLPAIISNILLVTGEGIVGDGKKNLSILHRDKERSVASKILPGIGNVLRMGAGYLVTAFGYVFALGHTLGCYLLDPIRSIRDSYKIGYNWGGVYAGFLFAAVSIIGIFGIYLTAFPLISQIALPAIPYIVTHLPRPVLDFVLNVAVHIIPTLYKVGTVLMPVATFIAKGLDILTFGLFQIPSIVASMPLMVGAGALFAPALALIGSPIDKIYRTIRDKWYGIKPKANIIIVEDGRVVENPKQYQKLMKIFAEHNHRNRQEAQKDHTAHGKLINYSERKRDRGQEPKTDEITQVGPRARKMS